MLKAVGAIEVHAPHGSMWAVFDSAYQQVGEGGAVEAVTPALTCRSIDAENLQLVREDVVHIGAKIFRVAHIEPDGTGESLVILKQ